MSGGRHPIETMAHGWEFAASYCAHRFGVPHTGPMHECPFQREIHGETRKTCNCCEECTQDCVDAQ